MKRKLALFIPMLALTLFFGLRWVEHMMTYHPVGYVAGPNWRLPAFGEDVWFPAANGAQLHGWFVRAPQQPARATILHCHGNGGNVTNVGWVAEQLSQRGYDVLVFDYRGYGRSAGTVTDESGLYADGAAAYEFLTRERGVKPEQLVLYGQSLGTTVAIDLAARQPVAALIIESGLSSASSMASASLPWLPAWLHWLGKNRFTSARKLANVHCPVLITHGDRDEVIPVEQGRQLFAAAREPKHLEIIPGGDHNLVGRGGMAYLEKVAVFIQAAVNPDK
jgi:fermentation-respiration switch protein FrsA (DUF1100 family)